MPSEARQKKIMEKLKMAQKCSILGPQKLGSRGGPGPQGPPGSAPGDDAAMMSELQHCCVSVRQCSGVSSESEAGLLVVTSMALAPECGLTFPWKCTC